MHNPPLSIAIEQAVEFYEKNYIAIVSFFLSPGKRHTLGSNHDRICRFCEKDETKTYFRSKAHAIPEFLGNKSIFSNYECDDCNQFFGSGIENDLGNWTKHSRTFSRIRGKKGVPSIKIQGLRIDYDYEGFKIKCNENDSHIEINEDKRLMKIDLTQDIFTPVAVLKAFVKIGLTLLPSEEVPNFKETLSWIRNPDHTQPFVTSMPLIHTYRSGFTRNDLLVAMVMRRKELIMNLPYAFLVLGFGNDVYQVFIPCPKQDREIDSKPLTIPPFPIPDGLDPEKYGKARCKLVDLCGRQPEKGENDSVVMGFDYVEISY